MPRILFVTVGTSAAENEEIAEHSPALKERLGDDDARTLIARLEDQPAQIAALQEVLLAAHREFWEKRDAYRKDFEHFRYTSAETISTFMALGPLHDLDKVVLLVSDTVIGRVCGRINKTIFCDYLFLPGDGSQQDTVIEEIKGLNPAPKKTEPFQEVYPQVRAILDRYTAGNTSQLIFNISGGFKGLIPPITHLACTEYKGRSPEILYLHETMRATVTLSPRQDGWKLDEEIRPNYYVHRR